MSSLAWSAAIVASLVATGVFAGGVWVGRRRGRPSGGQRALTRVDAHLEGGAAAAVPSLTLSPGAGIDVERLEADTDLAVLDRVLCDIRDIAQADESIFWRWVEARDTLAPTAWSSEGPRPVHFDAAEWAAHLRWSAEQRVTHLADRDDRVVFAAAPAATESKLFGVLTLTATDGLAMGPEGAREWMPRFAGQLTTLLQLFDTRREHGRHIRQNEALIKAVRQLQEHTNADALGEAVCLTALDVTSASAAVLVRWFPTDDHGTVQFATPGAALGRGSRIETSSLVANACRDALPYVLTNARATTAATSPYGVAVAPRKIGSLAIVPILRLNQVIGAIAVEGAAPEDIGQDEARNVALLGAVTRGSLEIVWEIEEVTIRARTDGLTGLSNRRHFDEQLVRVVAETDRFGGSCSLIVADIDHFKQVNDSHGHEAGDAVLKHVARLMAEGVRTVDICARYGGEEFAILLPQTPTKGAAELAERLREKLGQSPVALGGIGTEAISVSASFGVATYPDPVPYGDWLFLAADRALYSAKEAGRNRVKIITPSDVTTKLYKKPT